MGLRELVMLALVVSILCSVLAFGLQGTWDDVVYVFRRPGLLVRSLLAVFVVMPALVMLLVAVFDFRPEVEVALVALAISPMPPLLPKKLGKAGGHSSYAIGLMVTLGLSAIVVVPLMLVVIGQFAARPLGMAAGAIATKVLTMIVAPLVVGLILRAAAPALAATLLKIATATANILLPLGLLALLPVVLPAMWATIGEGTLVAMVLFVVAGLAVGHVLGGPDQDKATVLAIATASRHPAIALSIATTNFPEGHFGATILLFAVLSAIACLPYIAWQKGRIAAAFHPA